jgi:hypothetical protein
MVPSMMTRGDFTGGIGYFLDLSFLIFLILCEPCMQEIAIHKMIFKAMFKKSFIVNFSIGLRFEINSLSAN